MRSLLLAALPLSLSLVSCASDSEFDELAGETAEDEALDGKADGSPSGVYTYFSIAGDIRKCASPFCGGFHLDRLNRSTTTCHDGSVAESCYTPELDFSESNLAQAAQDKLRGAAALGVFDNGVKAIVRGRFAKTNIGPAPELGRFIVTEAWVAEGDGVSDGVFVKVIDSGIRCIVAPCPSLKEKALNTSRSALITDIDFAPAGLGDEQLGEVFGQINKDHGMIIAGSRFSIPGGKGRTATVAFSRLTNESGGCFVGGCSGQICSDEPGVISTCEFLPEYACYQSASCERQPTGECGWTPTPELQMCLGGDVCCDPAQNPGGIEGAHCCADGSWKGDIGNGGSDECIPFGGDGQVCGN